MNILLLLIPVALIIVAIAVWFFFWAVKTDQFDDLDRQGANILFDDDLTSNPTAPPKEPTQKKTSDDSVSKNGQSQ